MVFLVKKLRNYYFCVRHKNRRKHNEHLKLLFFNEKFTLWYIRTNIYIGKTKFTSHWVYLFDLFFSRKAKKTHTDQSILQAFLVCLKRNVSQTFKCWSSKKKSFPRVYIIDKNCIYECFLFHVITGRHYFLHKLSFAQRFGAITMLLPSFNKCFERGLHFMSVISEITLQCC